MNNETMVNEKDLAVTHSKELLALLKTIDEAWYDDLSDTGQYLFQVIVDKAFELDACIANIPMA